VPRRSRRRARRAQRARAGKAREKVCAIGKERAREGIRERRGREREGVIGFTGLAECAVARDPLLASPPDVGDPSPCADASYADAGDPPSLRGRRRTGCLLASPLVLHRQRPLPARTPDAGDPSLLLASLPCFFTDREVLCSLPTENREGLYVPPPLLFSSHLLCYSHMMA
jgi:hypothetical protein